MDKDEYVRKGDLLKKTKGIGIGSTRYRVWKPRTCVLLDVGTFFYYASDDKKKGNSSVAMINLRNPRSSVAPATNTKKPHCFTISDDEGESLFRARSDEEMQEWIDDIQLVLNKFHPRGRVTLYSLFKPAAPVSGSQSVEQPISQHIIDDDAAAEYESSSAGSTKPTSISGAPSFSPIPRSSSEADTKRTAATITSLPLHLSVLQASMKRTTSESSAPPSNDTSGDSIRPIEYSIPTQSPVHGPGRSIRGISGNDDSSAQSAGDSDSVISAPTSGNPIVSDSEEDDDDMSYFSKALKPSRRGSQYSAVVEHVRRASVASGDNSSLSAVHHGSMGRGNTFAPPAAASKLETFEESPRLEAGTDSRVPMPFYPQSPTPAIVPSISASTTSSSSTATTTSSTPRDTSSQSSVAPVASVSSPRPAGPPGLTSSANRWQTVKPQSSLSPRMVRLSSEKPQSPILLTNSSSAILLSTAELTKAPPTSISSPNLQRIANYHASRRRALGASGHINSMVVSETERALIAPPSPRISPTPSPTSPSLLDSTDSPKLSDEQVDDLVSELMKDVEELGMAGEDSQALGM